MLTAYAICLCAGGVFVLSSTLLGHGHADGDIGGDIDGGGDLDGGGDVDASGHDVDHPEDADGDADHGSDSGSTLWLPFLSLRFWTYGLAFFGLTGVLLEGLGAATGATGLAVSLGVGAFCGTSAAFIIRKLSRREVSSLPTALSYVGQRAEVLLDVGPGLPGRVRITVRGSMVDLPARTDGSETFARGRTILVLDMAEDGTAKVGPAGAEASPVPGEPAKT